VSQTHDEIRALRVMVDELRAETPPELDWNALEKRLLSQIDQQPSSLRRAAPSSSLARVISFAAAAAAIALGVGSMGSSASMPSAAAPAPHVVDANAVALAPGENDVHDLAALHAGDVIEAKDTPVRFGQAGLVTWTLAPGSLARVRTEGLGHTVALERGAIRAEVTPRDPSEGLVEAFAVEVEGTRVAVHGTAFSVERDGERAIVDVEHGAVAIGPRGHVGATTGHLLVGPSRASFSLDGGRIARLLPPRAPAPIAAIAPVPEPRAPEAPAPIAAAPVTMGGDPPYPPAQPVTAPEPEHAAPQPLAINKPAQPAHANAKPAPEAAPPAPAPAAPELPRITVGTVQARLNRCFKQTFEASSDSVRVSVASTLRVDLKPDGSMRGARFDPPIKPELQNCAVGALAGRFADGETHVDIPVSFSP
jgi:hypothetical protein